MKYFFVLLLLFPFLYGLSQSNRKRATNRFSYGISFSPDYTYRSYSSESVFPGDIWKELEDARFGYTTGFIAKYILNKSLALESGMLFSDKGLKIEDSGLQWITPDSDYSSSGEEYWIHSKYHYYYLGIPIKGNIYIINKNVKIFLSAGLLANLYLDSKVKTKYFLEEEKGSTKYSEENVEFNKVNLVGLVGAGAEYDLNRNFYLRLEPIFRYSFTNAATNVSAIRNWYSIGINCSVLFQK